LHIFLIEKTSISTVNSKSFLRICIKVSFLIVPDLSEFPPIAVNASTKLINDIHYLTVLPLLIPVP